MPPNGKIKRSSRGSERWVPWEYKPIATDVIAELKIKGYHIISAELAATSVPCHAIEYTFPLCLVLGREFDGVSSPVLALSDRIVSLPMFGMANSLNVSITAGVLLYKMMESLGNQGRAVA